MNNLKLFTKQGLSLLHTFTEKQLTNMVSYANNTYYNQQPIIDDSLYDILIEYISKKYPNNNSINTIGAPIFKNKVKLPYYMASLDKLKDAKKINNWKQKYTHSYVVSAKLDGISILYECKQNDRKLYTRGDGVCGLDISHLIPYLRLPNIKNTVIRGELIISKQNFEKYKKYKNARNFISGIANSKKCSKNIIKDIDFVAYEVIKPVLLPLQQMKWLIKNNFRTVKCCHTKAVNTNLLSTILLKWRKEYTYEIDGIVITHNKMYSRQCKNPEHSVAFKMVLTDQIAETTVVNVNWNISKDGYIKPVVQINPVNIKGSTIEHVTAYNAKFIADNKIGIGSVIQIIKSGDIIPKIINIIKPSDTFSVPNVAWKWNESKVDAILVSKNNDEMNIKNIEYFFKKIDIKSLGPGLIRKLYTCGYNTIFKILHITIPQLIQIEGIKNKLATKIVNGITLSIQNATLPIIMDASNAFGRGIGLKRIELILEKYPNITTIDTKNNNIQSIKGFSQKTSKDFLDYIPQFLDFLKENKLDYKLDYKLKQNTRKTRFSNKTIVFSGFRDSQLENKLNCKMSNSVTKNTDYLIVKDIHSNSSKIKKAKSLGIEIIEYKNFTI